jgi:hypothetical protein
VRESESESEISWAGFLKTERVTLLLAYKTKTYNLNITAITDKLFGF